MDTWTWLLREHFWVVWCFVFLTLYGLCEVAIRVRGLDENWCRAVTCGLIGHSRLRTFCFGYNYCARCDAQLGDSLGSAFQVTDQVIKGHDGSQKGCNCRTNFNKLTWRDRLYVRKSRTWEEWWESRGDRS